MSAGVRLEVKAERVPLVRKATALLRREVRRRCGVAAGGGGPRIVLDVRSGIGGEGFRIEDAPGGRVVVTGNDARGLLYGVGKLLRTSRFDEGRFTPGAWRGTSVPKCPMRGAYFASHFHNFYHDAPVRAVSQYVEELALWGTNALIVWFDMHHFKGIKDPAAQKMIERLRAVLRAGKGVGMNVGLCLLGNEAYADSPAELRSDPNTGRAHYRVELCPYKPGAKELMLRWFDEEFEAFSDIGIDHVWVWPYDQGGCACEKCKPWGANGFLVMAEAVAKLLHKRFPDAAVILSTWLYDYGKDQGEWSGLSKAFARRPAWLDYVLADGHAEFPKYVLTHDAPGGLPLLGFPEISMWGMYPWGGYGANPQPRRLQALWDVCGSRLSGGFPYSEGIFEDINKAIFSQFYWDERRAAAETVREYVAYECSPDVVDDVAHAIEIMEANHSRWIAQDEQRNFRLLRDSEGREHCAIGFQNKDAGAAECFKLLHAVDGRLTPAARKSWRWRILLLRAMLDRDLLTTGGVPTPDCEEAYEELNSIYHGKRAEMAVAPPTAEAVRRMRRG